MFKNDTAHTENAFLIHKRVYGLKRMASELMVRAKINEHAAKLLLRGTTYIGVSYTLADSIDAIKDLAEANYVVKVVSALKRYNQLELVTLNFPFSELLAAILKYFYSGYDRMVIEKWFRAK